MSDLEPTRNIGAIAARIALTTALAGRLGAFIAAVLDEVIPTVRTKRISAFVGELDERLAGVPDDVLGLRLEEPERFDLVEDGFWAAARTSSRDRAAHLANIVANGLKAEEVRALDRRHVLKLLSEINDVEVLTLQLHYCPTNEDRAEFRKKHHGALDYVQAWYGAPNEVVDRDAIRKDYIDHLLRLGLLERNRGRESPTTPDEPKFDSTGLLNGEVTALGSLLLHEIGCTPNRPKPPDVRVRIG